MNSKSKKTANVAELLEIGNKYLAMPECDIITKGFKDGVCSMLEAILQKSNNYEGFVFLNNADSDYNTFGYVSRRYLRNEKTTK